MSVAGQAQRIDDRGNLRPLVAQLFRYWHNLGGGRAPERALIDPADIKELLPFLMLVEISEPPFRVRYRLTGTRVDEQTGMNLTDHFLDEFAEGTGAAAVSALIEAYRLTVESAQPHHGVYEWPTRGGYLRQIGFGLFPLRVGGAIRQCLSIEDYSDISFDTPLSTWAAPVTDPGAEA